MIRSGAASPIPRFVPLLALALAAAQACGGGGGGGGGGDPHSPPLCTPSCAGKQCGPDGCGGSCGGCDDSSACTGDSCSADGQCVHAPLSSQTCTNLIVDVCTQGTASKVDCRTYCKRQNQNIAASCGALVGCTSDACCCANDAAHPCNSSSWFCQTGSMQGSCDPVLGEWSLEDCRAYCASFGYPGTAGCRPAPFGFCTCEGVSAGKWCHGPQGDCSDHALCCPGLICTWQYLGGAGRYSCLPPTTCEARCREGSVCCGGGFCSGSCIGNPCCS